MKLSRQPALWILGLLVLGGMGYGAWTIARKPVTNSSTTTTNTTPAQQYTDAYNEAFRSSTEASRTLVDATYFSSTLTAALNALPQKSDQQTEVSRKLAELNGDQKRAAFVVSYSVPSGSLPDDAVVEASTLTDELDRSYPLFASQRIYSATTSPAQVAPLLQHSYLLVFNTPGGIVSPYYLKLVVSAGDARPRFFDWSFQVSF